MIDALPIWARHAWRLLTPCTSGWRCVKCSTVSTVATKVEPCPGPAVSGPPERLAWWSVARPVWLYQWPDGQQQSFPADPDEHLQHDRYHRQARLHVGCGMPAPLRVAWLDRRLQPQRTLEDGPRPLPSSPTPSTWLPPNASPAEPTMRPLEQRIANERPEIGPDNAKPRTSNTGRTT